MTLCNLYFYKLIHFNFIFRFIVSFLSWQFLSPFEKSSIHVLLYIRVYIFKLNTDKGNVEVKMDFNVKTQEKITRFQNAHVSLLCSPVIKNSPCVYVFLSYSLNQPHSVYLFSNKNRSTEQSVWSVIYYFCLQNKKEICRAKPRCSEPNTVQAAL